MLQVTSYSSFHIFSQLFQAISNQLLFYVTTTYFIINRYQTVSFVAFVVQQGRAGPGHTGQCNTEDTEINPHKAIPSSDKLLEAGEESGEEACLQLNLLRSTEINCIVHLPDTSEHQTSIHLPND